jgi:hypothetical protein
VGNSRLIFWSVSELGGAIDASKRAGHNAEKSDGIKLPASNVPALQRNWKRGLPLPRSLVKFACAPTLGCEDICYLSGGDEVIE